MQDGSLWNAVDVLIEDGGPLRERGGWSAVANIATGSGTQVVAGIYAPFNNGAQNLALTNGSDLFLITPGSAVIAASGVGGPKQNPIFHNNLVIVPSYDGINTVWKYDGSSAASLTAAPTGMYACVYKDYTILGASSTSANRAWFSEPGVPNGTWDTTSSWLQFSQPIRGFASLRNAVLVFGDGVTARIRGSIPPPDTDMVVDDPVFQVGITDARSIAYHGENAIWCSTEGVFRSDGVALDDLSRKGGMKSYWQDLFADYSSTWTTAGGVLFDTYFVAVLDGGTFKDAFAVDLNTYSWTRITNLKALSFWPSVGAIDELYFGRRDQASIGRMSSIWSPSSTTKNDGNGTAVTGVIETPFYEGRPGLKQWIKGFASLDVTEHASDSPSATIQAVWTPESTSYETLKTVSATDAYSRTRFDMNKRAHGVGFKIARSGAGDFRFYSLEAEMNPLEKSRVA